MSLSHQEPVSDDLFATLLAPLLPPDTKAFACAVSGGPDSTALMLLADRYAKAHGLKAYGLLVDHRMRPESEQEAADVCARLRAQGITMDSRVWDHGPLTTRLHVLARAARYDLLGDMCRAHNVTHLLLAHHRQDQAETILLRLAKGSGIDGLAGMAPVAQRDGLTLIRPLLSLTKENLIATCHAAQVAYATDPSNEYEKYARARLRHLLPSLEKEGLTVQRFFDLGTKAREAVEALNAATDFLQKETTTQIAGDILILRADAFESAPQAIAARLLVRALHHLHATPYPPEREEIQSLVKTLRAQGSVPTRSLHGSFISKTENKIILLRDATTLTDAQSITAGQEILWDKRWLVHLAQNAPFAQGTIKALGPCSHDETDRLAPRLRHDVPQGRARAALPALWQGDKLLALPALAQEKGAAAFTATPLPFLL